LDQLQIFVAATQKIADWNKKRGMFEYVDHFADQVPSPEGAWRSNLARDDGIRALRIPVDGAVQIREAQREQRHSNRYCSRR